MESPPAPDEDVNPEGRARTGAGLAGVILCGGRSSRMGVDKATLIFEGATLLDRALERLDAVCDPVLIAPGDVLVSVARRRLVSDAVPGAGPLGGLVAALRASPHRLLAVVAVDLPWVDPGLIAMLAAGIGDHDVAVCETSRGIEPLHAVYSRSILEMAEAALAGPDRSLRHLIERSSVLRVSEREWRAAGISDKFSRNVNTPEDFAGVSRRRLQ